MEAMKHLGCLGFNGAACKGYVSAFSTGETIQFLAWVHGALPSEYNENSMDFYDLFEYSSLNNELQRPTVTFLIQHYIFEITKRFHFPFGLILFFFSKFQIHWQSMCALSHWSFVRSFIAK